MARIQAKNLYLKSCFSLTSVGGMGEMKITSELRMKRQEVCLSDDLDFDRNIVKHAKHGIFVGVMWNELWEGPKCFFLQIIHST